MYLCGFEDLQTLFIEHMRMVHGMGTCDDVNGVVLHCSSLTSLSIFYSCYGVSPFFVNSCHRVLHLLWTHAIVYSYLLMALIVLGH